ncbi:MAG: four helix bundle protein [bacterium]|nr:four helix bundle protein [bacterium]
MTPQKNVPLAPKYDLEERTGKFGESIISLCKSLEQNVITNPLINQIVKSGTSIGANDMEDNGASSKKGFPITME